MSSKVKYPSTIIEEVISVKIDEPKPKTDQFKEVFSEILDAVSSLVKHEDDNNVPGDISEWLKIVMLYNVPQGKQIRGRMVAQAYSLLAENLTEDKIKLARVLGWIVEIASYLVADDIMDNGLTRRGRPCWYLVNAKGNIAFNDALLLEHLAYQLLRHYFSTMDVYTELLDRVLELTFKTVVGETLDTKVDKKSNYEGYTESMYDSIVLYKTAYYTVYLPIALAMTLAGISEREPKNQLIWQQVEHITLKMGKLFQIQDDYLDCFADVDTLGKVGRDIEEGKCTWLFVKATELCTFNELQLLKNKYGSENAENVAAVKSLYASLDIPGKFCECQENLSQDILAAIKTVDNEKLRGILKATLETIYKRKF